jgi:hypothetical protein
VLAQVAGDSEKRPRLLDRQRLGRATRLTSRRVDESRHVPADQIPRFRVPNRPRQSVVRYRHGGRRLLAGQHRQSPAHVVRRQVPQHSATDLLDNRLQHEPILRDRRLRPAIEPRLQPVLDSLPHRIASGSADARGDVLPQLAELVAHLGPGPAANRTATTLAVGGVAKRDRSDPVTIDRIKVDTVVTVTPAHTRHTEEPNSLALGLALF